MKKTRCDFCNKILNKEKLSVNDDKRSYTICKACNDRVVQCYAEYQKKANELSKIYHKQLDNIMAKLRKKYKLNVNK